VVAPAALANPLLAYLEGHPDGRIVHRWRHYFDIYHRHLARFRGRPVTMIEIGVFNGGSLPMWRDYLGAQARIVGVDLHPECARFASAGIEIAIGDQGDRAFLRDLAARYPDPAIVLDDGGHRMEQQIATFEELYPRIAPDGIYVCEDTHSSYLPQFGGGAGQAGTFIESVKPLIDKLHAWFSPDPAKLAPDEFTRTTQSLHFYDSLLVIEKGPHPMPEQVVYGNRAVFKYGRPSVAIALDDADFGAPGGS
jgi:hypothetical protein